ncbi:MAG: hypothetical protein LBC78_05040, partial [Oscillospiraceae bacterium]|nr:hypothetical protein [Oscillospiraceae bacterium]
MWWSRFCAWTRRKSGFVIITVIGALLAMYTVALTFRGELWGLVSVQADAGGGTSRVLTPGGWILITLVFVYNIIMPVIRKKNEDDTKNEQKRLEGEASNAIARSRLYNNMICEFSESCQKKAHTVQGIISRILRGKREAVPILTKPCDQLNQLLDSMREISATMLAVGYEISKDDIYISLAFQTMNNEGKAGKWEWASINRQEGLSFEELTNGRNPKSTFQTLLESGNPYIFSNSKQALYQAGQYIPDR